jgi:hypothetical protein
MSLKNSNDTIGNRTRDLPVCSVVPYPLGYRTQNIKFCILLFSNDSLYYKHFKIRNSKEFTLLPNISSHFLAASSYKISSYSGMYLQLSAIFIQEKKGNVRKT